MNSAPPTTGVSPPSARPTTTPAGLGADTFLAAVDQAPLVMVTRARLLVAQSRGGAAGVLSDPVISAEWRRMRDERTNGIEVWLEQDLPPLG